MRVSGRWLISLIGASHGGKRESQFTRLSAAVVQPWHDFPTASTSSVELSKKTLFDFRAQIFSLRFSDRHQRKINRGASSEHDFIRNYSV